jgi:DNA-binding transcriptional LysR family regulator
MTSGWQQLRFADLLIFLTVRRCGTVSGAARELGTTPSQVSKTIARLEAQLGRKLLVRQAHGVTISDEGQRTLPDLEEIVARARRLGRSPSPLRELTIAAAPPLGELLMPLLAEPQLRLRALELPAPAIRAYAARGLFDVALTAGGPSGLPASWIARTVGHVRKALFGTPAVRELLGPAPIAPERVAELPFVQLVSCFAGETFDADDDSLLPVEARNIVHQAGTIALCFALAARTDSVAFGPLLAARPFVEAGLLVPLPVPGWDVDEPLLLACNQDRVTSPQRRRFEAALTVSAPPPL